MIPYKVLKQFVKHFVEYERIANTSQENLEQRFLSFQYKRKPIKRYRKKSIIRGFEYVTELIFIETDKEYSELN